MIVFNENQLIRLMAEKNGNRQPLILNESIKQSIVQSPEFIDQKKSGLDSTSKDVQIDVNTSPRFKKMNCRYKALQICSGVCLIISLLIALGLPPMIEHIIVEQAKQQIIMTPDNEGRWAHFPGDSQTVILRNFTFFKLDNEGQFIFNHAKPIFRQYTGFKIQQIEDFLDIQYQDNGNLVKVRDWLRFAEWAQSKNLDQKVSILNMGSLGYWSRLKLSRPTIFLQQGLALLFTNLQTSIIPNLIGSAISQQYLKNISLTFSAFLSPAGVSKNNADFMWFDPVYGLSSSENLGFWAQAAINCFQNTQKSFVFSSQSTTLKNHYVLTDSQLKILMNKIYNYVTSLRKLLLQNHYCAQINMEQCTGRYLAVLQFAKGWVTANPPPVSTIIPNDTICDNNITCKGKYPQLYAFANNVFKINEKIANKLDFHPSLITFPRQSVLNWFNYNNSIEQGLNYNTAQNCLLHIGNLDDLWYMGMEFQKNFDVKLLQPIKVRFGLQDNAQTLVFWQWIKYFSQNFVLQHSPNSYLGISSLFTSGFYESFSTLKNNIQRFLLSKMLNKDISSKECHQFFQSALDQHQKPQLINQLCIKIDLKSQETSAKLVDVCEFKYGQSWKQLKQFGVSLQGMENLCDIQGINNVGNRLHNYKLDLDKLYKCTATPNPYCSDFELALIQWYNSTVTLNPPKGLDLPVGQSYSLWNQQAKSFQYYYFIKKYFEKEEQMFPKYSLSQLFQMFTFQGLFSTNLMLKKLSEKSLNPYFYNYIRYICIFVSLNGLTTTRTVRQLLFGYQDEFLEKIIKNYPPFGGDPSVNSHIAINDLNNTKENAKTTFIFKTGKDDYSQVNQYYEINGYKYLVNNYSSFNGNKTIWQWRSPWAENDYFYGTSGKIFSPNQFKTDNISTLIPNVQRYGSNHFHNQTQKSERYGAQVYIVHLTSSLGIVGPSTAKYYQTIPNLFNVTSIYGLPIYISRNHFMNSANWINRVDIYNEDKSILYKQTSQYDNSFILMEPYTGVSFQSCLFLQNNYFHQKDQLFDYPTDTMLPTFSVSRSGNLTQAKFHQLFDNLITALSVKSSSIYVGIGLGIFSVIILVFATIKKRKLSNFQPKSSQLGISLQQIASDKQIQKNDGFLKEEIED